jgi:hypothetical protein
VRAVRARAERAERAIQTPVARSVLSRDEAAPSVAPTTRTRVLRVAGRDASDLSEVTKWRRVAIPTTSSLELLRVLASVPEEELESVLPADLFRGISGLGRVREARAVTAAEGRIDEVTARESAPSGARTMQERVVARAETPVSTAATGSTVAAVAQRAETTTRRIRALYDAVLPRPAAAAVEAYLDGTAVPGLPRVTAGSPGAVRTPRVGAAAQLPTPAPAESSATGGRPAARRATRAIGAAARRGTQALPTTSAVRAEWDAAAPRVVSEREVRERPLERILGARPDELMARPYATPRTSTAARAGVTADAAYLAPHTAEPLVWSEEIASFVPVSLVNDPVAAVVAGYGGAAAAQRLGLSPTAVRAARGDVTKLATLPSLARGGEAASGAPDAQDVRAGVSAHVARRRDGIRRAMVRARDPMDLARVIVQRPADALEMAEELPDVAAKVVREIVKMRTLPDEAQELLSAQLAGSSSGPQSGNAAMRARRTRKRQTREQARKLLGMGGGGSSSAKGGDGVRQSRLSKLSQKLQSLIHLAEGQAADAENRVRRSDEKVDSPAAKDNSVDSSAEGVTLAALQREVLMAVLMELDQMKDRREGGPNVDIWW